MQPTGSIEKSTMIAMVRKTSQKRLKLNKMSQNLSQR